MYSRAGLTTRAGTSYTSAGFGALPTGILGTTIGGRPPSKLQEGEFTKTVYSLIAEQKYEEVRTNLVTQLESNSYIPKNSRAALSLLAYVNYMLQDFSESAKYYEQLVKICPEVDQYKVYHAQALFKAGLYAECIKAASQIHSPENSQKLSKLLAMAYYELDELVATKEHVENCLADDPDSLVIEGCILFKENNFEKAREKFQSAQNITNYEPHIAYNIALCYYTTKNYTPSLKHMQEIIERGIREHPELSVGSNSEGYEVMSVGNSQTLRDTALVEAFNLKMAIEYMTKNYEAANEALKDMPPRLESELDAVTLHNQALLQMETDPTTGFKKLKYLLQNPPFPPETFSNLLILYCKYGLYYVAADILVENGHLTFKFLSRDLYDFLEAVLDAQTSPEEAFYKFDLLAKKHIEMLRKLTKVIQDARTNRDAGIKKAVKDYDEALEAYIPVLMAMAKIYWDRDNYPKVEEILMKSIEFCSEHEVWKLNMAHTYFMQNNKFKEAIAYYKPIVLKQKDRLLEVPAMVLANLCVSYIMTSQNDEAEQWMRNIEKEEDRLAKQMPEKQSLHLCIVNLVIGTLYCSKGHYDFGICRVIKSLEPYNKKIMSDTWFYVKRCFLSLAENLCKHMIIIKDETYNDILQFLDAASTYGKKMFLSPNNVALVNPNEPRNTITMEARMLKKLFLSLRE